MKVPFDTTPRWKPPTGFLGGHTYGIDRKTLNVSEQWSWGVEDWREYARLLNIELAHSQKQLADCRNELSESKRKASRGKRKASGGTKPIQTSSPLSLYLIGSQTGSLLTGTLLTGFDTPKRGRKKGGQCDTYALKALARQDKNKVDGIKITDAEVVRDLLVESLPPGDRPSKIVGQVRGITNAMSKFRKSYLI